MRIKKNHEENKVATRLNPSIEKGLTSEEVKQRETDGLINKDDKVLAFQEAGVPGKLFKYLYNDLELDVTFLNDAAAVKNAILTEQ